MKENVAIIELREIYDGWSIGIKADGSWENRWDKNDPRYAPTQEFIDKNQDTFFADNK